MTEILLLSLVVTGIVFSFGLSACLRIRGRLFPYIEHRFPIARKILLLTLMNMVFCIVPVLAAIELGGRVMFHNRSMVLALGKRTYCQWPFAACNDRYRVVLDTRIINRTGSNLAEVLFIDHYPPRDRKDLSFAPVTIFNKGTTTLLIVWKNVYATANRVVSADGRTDRRPEVLSQWCAATISINHVPPLEKGFMFQEGELILLFERDGSVRHQIGARGAENAPAAYLYDGVNNVVEKSDYRCKKTVPDPWHGIDSSNPWA